MSVPITPQSSNPPQVDHQPSLTGSDVPISQGPGMLGRRRRSEDPVDLRFLRSRTEADPETGCWNWTGSLVDGYAHLTENRKGVYAHRRMWSLAYGPIPQGLWVLHRCDNPRCINPDHLFLGTNNDNVQDMVRKGRNHNAGQPRKLNAEQVKEIRESTKMCSELANQFGVSESNIRWIRKRGTWKWV